MLCAASCLKMWGVGLTLARSFCQYTAPAAPLTASTAVPTESPVKILLRAETPVTGSSMPSSLALLALTLCLSATMPARNSRIKSRVSHCTFRFGHARNCCNLAHTSPRNAKQTLFGTQMVSEDIEWQPQRLDCMEHWGRVRGHAMLIVITN